MTDSASALPSLTLYDHQTVHAIDVSALEELARRALPLVQQEPGASPSVLGELEEIEVSLVDDSTIAQVHGDFLNDPTPTDVITFHHGEVLVSTETAAREAAVRGLPLGRELLLYIIHGLLHLHGHTDADPEPRAIMHATQERLLAQLLDDPAVN